MLNVIEDAEKIRDELFRINIGLWNYAKNHNPKTIEANRNRQLVSVAFTDWGIDVHHPEGFWVKGNDCIHVYHGRRICIPYRTLYSRNIANLLMAGRCHSATHIAMGGTRVMRPVCMMGQAAGTAAAVAIRHGTMPRGVYERHIKELQQALLKDGCFLPGVRNTDCNDLALGARVTASSFAEGMEPGKVNNGWNRVVGEERNAWAPEAEASLPQWIQLELEQRFLINSVYVSFEDTKKMGVDFTVEVRVADSWKKTAEVTNNQLRRRVMRFEAVETDKVRVVVTRTSTRFAMCEIRVYRE
jgi:hypothetical protein